MTALGQGLGCGLSLEIGVAQIIQRDRHFQPKQVSNTVEQMAFNLFLGGAEQVAGTVQLHHAHALVVHLQQFAQSAALLQPAIGSAFRAGCGHAPDDGADGGQHAAGR